MVADDDVVEELRKQAERVPALKVQRRILEDTNLAKRPIDLARRFDLEIEQADEILTLRDKSSPFGFHRFTLLWEAIDLDLRVRLLRWYAPWVIGRWQDPIDIPDPYAEHEAPVHAAVLKNGKVLFIPHGHDFAGAADPYLWDPADSDPTTAFHLPDNVPSDILYCCGHAFMSDGRLFCAGGGGAYRSSALYACWIFDPDAGTDGVWSEVPEPMIYKRWYPTVVALGDRKILIVAGAPNPTKIELFHESPSVSPRFEEVTTTNDPAVSFRQTYPGLHLLPNEHVFNTPTGFGNYGATTWTGTMPEDARTLERTGTTGEWKDLTDMGAGPMDTPHRAKGMSALILERCASGSYVTKVITAGGGGTNTAEVVDFSTITPTWKTTPTIPGGGRNNTNLVLLPDGTVFLCGGALGTTGVDQCALYDPMTDTWAPMDSLTYLRAYHSVAVLLPTGQVAVTGDEESYSIEVFSPPYLYSSYPRPKIGEDCPDVIHHGSTFSLTFEDAEAIERVVLVKAMAVTHQTDSEQRVVALEMSVSGNTISAVAPDGNHPHPIAVRGYYMLFLIGEGGVPSEAKFVWLH